MADKIFDMLRETRPLSREAADLIFDLDEATLIERREFPLSTDPWSTEKPRFYFSYWRNGQRLERYVAWSWGLDEQLRKRAIRMDHLEEEAARGGTLLIDNLQYPDVQFGKDYTDHVFWHVANDRFGHFPAMKQTLSQIPSYGVSMSPSFTECFNYVKASVDGYGNSLVLQLQYDDPTAYRVLVGAVWYVLDRRHSIGLRRSLFP